MKAGSKTKLVGKGSETKLGRPEQDLAIEKPTNKPVGKTPEGFVRMQAHRAFQLTGKDGKLYGGKEGDVVDVPLDVAEELEHGFTTYFDHEGLINKKNAKRTVVQRATRI